MSKFLVKFLAGLVEADKATPPLDYRGSGNVQDNSQVDEVISACSKFQQK